MPIFSFIEHNLQDLFEKETTGGEYIYQRVRLFIYQTMCVSKLTRKDISDVVFSKFTHVSLYKSAEIHTSVNAYGICNNGPFGNIGIGISASASALTSVSTSALQQIYFVFRSLYFCLSKFYMKKTSMVKYFFQVNLLTFLGVSGDVWSSYSVENPLAPASEERNSKVDVILGVLKQARLKAAFCRFVKF